MAEEEENKEQEKKEKPQKSIKDFFESVPPGLSTEVSDLYITQKSQYSSSNKINTPDLLLYCNFCNGDRYFECKYSPTINPNEYSNNYLVYVCRNCGKRRKTFAVQIHYKEVSEGAKGTIFKYGEIPAFGPPLPQRLLKLAGDDKDLLLVGFKAEKQGMGIGSFAYYRRFVENQKNMIFDEIIKVAEKTAASKDMIEELNAARTQKKFTEAVDKVKHGIPPVLLIGDQNPLTLLHYTLSEAIHQYDDWECLELAASIRQVLTDLVERAGQALKDEKELHEAVSKLIKVKSKKKDAEKQE
jgi:hypothetical protein